MITYCDVNTCEDCQRYGDDCDGDKRVEHTDTISRADAIDCCECHGSQECKDRIKALPSADADWIPCGERLPDNKTYVLTTIQVSGRQPHARSGFYHDGFFHNDNGDTWRTTDREVRAWMPLPKPYREESEVEE